MGLFDFFKKKNDEPKPLINTDSEFDNTLFKHLSRYNEYIIQFISMQQRGNYAPVAAYENNDGELIGHLYVNTDGMYSLSIAEVIERMKAEFEENIQNDAIKSYTIYYHSQHDGSDEEHKIAQHDNEFKAISINYSFGEDLNGYIALPYHFEGPKLTYARFKEFSPEQNNYIVKTKINENKDYFQERISAEPEVVENEVGLKITKSNTADNNNTWYGIFGFDSFVNSGGNEKLKEYIALSLTKEPTLYREESVAIRELMYDAVSFKTISVKDEPRTCIPVIKTDYAIEVLNKEINEWEHVENTEAIVTGSGRDTFGIKYLATDYAENRELYLTKRNLDINISGIVYTLEIYSHDDEDEEAPKFSKDFTAYMPNEDLANYGCFDFIGQLEDFREINILEDKSLKAYIINVRLITNPDINDFFTIDMYVAADNMQFETLEKGMKITGMFQMQGQIKK